MKQVEQILAVRDAGNVERCHTIPHHGEYSNAKHCYGAVSLVLLLHPNPSMDLIRAIQFHDVAEYWLGDMPSPGKRAMPDAYAMYKKYEAAKLVDVLGDWPELTPEDELWFKAADQIDFLLWAMDQYSMGNQKVLTALKNVQAVIGKMELPLELRLFWESWRNSAGL